MTSHQGAALAIRARQPRSTGPVPAHPLPAAGTGPAARGVHGADGVPGAEKARRILVVDDEPNIRSFIGRALTAAGYLIGFAGSGSEGLRHALDEHYDLVILDLVMP
ncbi:MAG TPA: response regulator, partial [Streptosporangiaceae bacterium]